MIGCGGGKGQGAAGNGARGGAASGTGDAGGTSGTGDTGGIGGSAGGTGGTGGSGGADAGPGDGSTPTDGGQPRSCDGVSCSDAGTCFIDKVGFARCNCDISRCVIPTADLQCLGAWRPCLDHPISCGSPAFCSIYIDNCTCATPTNPVQQYCKCQNGYRYDGTTCVKDVAACADPRKTDCDYDPSNSWWELHATGDVTFDVVGRGTSNRYWDSDGVLGLYNDIGAAWCGDFAFGGGRFASPGSYTFKTTPMAMGLTYGDKYYRSNVPGADGTMVINAVSWCKDFNCTVVDLTFNGTLATDSGALVQVQGFVKGTTF
jgi:hypothetical protein